MLHPEKMIDKPLKLLVVEGYAKAARETLRDSGMAVASDLYKSMLLSIAPNATVDIVTPADVDTSLPIGVEVRSYDGVTMTGSNLSVLDRDNPSVQRQIEFQKRFSNKACRVLAAVGHCRLAQSQQAVKSGLIRKEEKWALRGKSV